MVESKFDELSATGKHRAWSGEGGTSASGPAVRAGAPRDVQRNWLDRSQPANPRHGAITRTLYSWNNYKSWTDRVKGSFDKEGDKDKKPK